MSCYRPSCITSTPLITPEGTAWLHAELHELWYVRRPQVTRAVSEATALDNRSENTGYIYGKRMLREIDSRTRFLRKRLKDLKVVGKRSADPNQVYFGAWVTLEGEDGGQAHYHIVGPDELDLHSSQISIDLPLARALIDKELDAEVPVRTPVGEKSQSVVETECPPAPWRATRSVQDTVGDQALANDPDQLPDYQVQVFRPEGSDHDEVERIAGKMCQILAVLDGLDKEGTQTVLVPRPTLEVTDEGWLAQPAEKNPRVPPDQAGDDECQAQLRAGTGHGVMSLPLRPCWTAVRDNTEPTF